MPAAPDLDRDPILLFDGECGLCARSVRWLLARERADDDGPRPFLAPLQGPTAQALRARHPRIPTSVDTVVYVDGGRVYLRTKAFLHVARHLRRPWRWAYAWRWLPGWGFDLGYRLIARVRYRIWGKADACALPTAAQRARLLP